MSQADGLLATAERVMERARSGPKVSGAEAYVVEDADVAVHVEKNSAGQVMAREAYGIGIRVLVDGRLGFAYVTREEDVDDAIGQAREASRLSKKTRFAFASGGKAPKVARLWDPRVADLEASEVVSMGASVVDAVTGVRQDLNAAGGGVSAGTQRWAVANSEGLTVAGRASGFSASCYVVQDRDGVSTGTRSRSSTRIDFEPADMARVAAELAVASAKPSRLELPGPLPVVVRPDAAADLLATITMPSLSGRSAHRQESFYTGKVGRQVADHRIGITEDPTLAGGLGSGPVDDEGVPSRPVRLIDRGILKRFLFDVATAAEYDERTTGSGVRAGGLDGRSYKAPPTVSSRQVRLVAPSTTTERLVGSVDDGILVHDLMGVHTANTVSGDFGVTASLLFRIRGGQVAEALEPVSVSGNFHEVLRKGLRLGDDVEDVDAGTAFRLPTVLFEGFTVTP